MLNVPDLSVTTRAGQPAPSTLVNLMELSLQQPRQEASQSPGSRALAEPGDFKLQVIFILCPPGDIGGMSEDSSDPYS